MNDKRSYTNFLDKNEFNFTINNGKIEFTKLLSKIKRYKLKITIYLN
jgi:hypothetical protein